MDEEKTEVNGNIVLQKDNEDSMNGVRTQTRSLAENESKKEKLYLESERDIWTYNKECLENSTLTCSFSGKSDMLKWSVEWWLREVVAI